jgi:hypothetical protein
MFRYSRKRENHVDKSKSCGYGSCEQGQILWTRGHTLDETKYTGQEQILWTTPNPVKGSKSCGQDYVLWTKANTVLQTGAKPVKKGK